MTARAPSPMQPRSSTQQLAGLAAWILFTFVFAGIGSAASIQAQAFYRQLLQPAWAPPAWLFGPVWTALYLMIALAAWLVWRGGGMAPGAAGADAARPRATLLLFVAQLALNALWTWLFFAWHQGASAFGEILVLWLLIAATIAAFWRRDRWAGLLLVPYICWVSFATCLCYSVWQRNPSLL